MLDWRGSGNIRRPVMQIRMDPTEGLEDWTSMVSIWGSSLKIGRL